MTGKIPIQHRGALSRRCSFSHSITCQIQRKLLEHS